MQPSRVFVLFVIVGGAAAALNVGSRSVIERYTSFEIAVVLAFPIATIFAYLANRTFVFGSSGAPWHLEYGRFLLVNLAALIQVWLVSVGLVKIIFPSIQFYWHPETIGHGIGVLSPVVTSYYAHKHFSFKGSNASASIRNRT